jgi:hypothetical protein
MVYKAISYNSETGYLEVDEAALKAVITARDKQVAEAASERMRERAALLVEFRAFYNTQKEITMRSLVERGLVVEAIRAIPLTEPADSGGND